jgi:hypothetical protein
MIDIKDIFVFVIEFDACMVVCLQFKYNIYCLFVLKIILQFSRGIFTKLLLNLINYSIQNKEN